MLIGYGRVSTADQNPAHQADALARAGVAARDIHIDTASGEDVAAEVGIWCCSCCASKQRLARFLRDELRLELSASKTLITHARTGAARFLGYEITVQHNNSQATRRSRAVNGQVALRVPPDVLKAKSAPYLRRGQPAKQKALTSGDDYTIVAAYGATYRGIVQYYLLAGDVQRLHRLRWVMETSMLKTVAGKHRSSMSKMAARHKAKIATPYGPRTCFEARIERDGRQPLVTRFGEIPLHQRKTATVTDRQPIPVDYPHKELPTRLLAGTCEICQHTGQVEAHHIRKLQYLGAPGPLQPQWANAMANQRRKTLVVCATCHGMIHTRQPAPSLTQ